MYWFFLVVSFISGARMQITTNVDDSTRLQLKFDNLENLEARISNEINNYFSQVDDPQDWRKQNSEAILENSRLLLKLQENVSSTMNIFNHTQAFVERTSTTLFTSCMQSENERSEAITKALAKAALNAAAVRTNLEGSESRLETARAQQLEADERLKEAQAMLAGLRSAVDALKKREGALDHRLGSLLNVARAQEVRTKAIKEGKSQAKEQVENIKIKTEETEKAIERATNELQKLKTSHRVVNPRIAPGVNFVKSVKTASGKGKQIKLILLSD